MPTKLKKSLFWDVSETDEERNGRFIIERILNFGDQHDFQKALKRYGKQAVADVVLESRNLNKKSQSFWCQYFNLDPKKCLNNALAMKQSLFWKR